MWRFNRAKALATLKALGSRWEEPKVFTQQQNGPPFYCSRGTRRLHRVIGTRDA